MDAEFWVQRWEKREIAFHNSAPHPLLVKHCRALSLPQNARVFLPLCGKTKDIAWLLSQGYRVAGIELVETAVRELFAELNHSPKIQMHETLCHYSAPGLDIFCGDIFHLSAEILGKVDAVYDRGALVALPEDLRLRYTAHLKLITNHSPQLLISYEYDQSRMPGPPFSISAQELDSHYSETYHLKILEDLAVSGGLKGILPACETIRLLTRR